MMLICRQRVVDCAGTAACSVTVTVLFSPRAKPSRLKITVDMPLLASKVSPSGNALFTRKTTSGAVNVPVPLTSENTIQPFCQAMLPLQVGFAVVEFAEAHTDTVWPSLMASERAYCMSPRSPLTSPEMRLAVVTY